MHRKWAGSGMLVVSAALAVFLATASLAQEQPTISDMASAVQGESPLSTDVAGVLTQAEEMLGAGDASGAKLMLMRLERTPRIASFSDEDLAAMQELQDRVDQALGGKKDKAVKEADAVLKAEGLEPLPPYAMSLLEARMRDAIQMKVNRREAEMLVEEATTQLYIKQNFDEALRLANTAIALDDTNKDAQRLAVEARASMGVKEAEREMAITTDIRTPGTILKAKNQELANAMTLARRHFSDGEYEKSAEQWRQAKMVANFLSVYGDVNAQQVEIDKSLAVVDVKLNEAEQALERKRQQQSTAGMSAAIAETERARLLGNARLLQQADDAARRKDYDNAEKILKEAHYQNPSDISAVFMQQDVSKERHKYWLGEYLRKTDDSERKLKEQLYEKSIPYPGFMTYPNKKFWDEVVRARASVALPSKEERRTPEEQVIHDKLRTTYKFDFQNTRLPDVVEVLQKTSGINFALDRRQLDQFENPITLYIVDAPLRTVLDEVTNLAGMGWKVEGSVIKIALPESLKQYELRTYDIRDLLINTTDHVVDKPFSIGSTADDDDDSTTTYGSTTYTYGSSSSSTTSNDTTTNGTTTVTESLWERAESLRELIQTTVAPYTWVAGGPVGNIPDDGGTSGTRQWGEWGEQTWGTTTTPATPTTGGVAAEGLAAPKGRAFFRPGNPGDLLILQTPEVHAQIEDLLSELRRALTVQVNVEARFVEISSDAYNEMGFNWSNIDFSPGGDTEDVKLLTGLPFFGETAATGLEVTFGFFDSVRIEGVFKAMQQNDRTRVLDAPNITLMSAQLGHITIETTENYVGSFQTGEGQFEPEINSISSAVQLSVRPIVSSDRRYVFLELEPTITQLLPYDTYTFTSTQESTTTTTDTGDETTTAGGLVTNVIKLPRQVSETFATTVCVPDQGVLMVGGLAKHTMTEIERGTPILNKIPVLKRLFTADGRSNEQSMLMIFVKPHIIIIPEQEKLAY